MPLIKKKNFYVITSVSLRDYFKFEKSILIKEC